MILWKTCLEAFEKGLVTGEKVIRLVRHNIGAGSRWLTGYLYFHLRPVNVVGNFAANPNKMFVRGTVLICHNCMLER